MEKLYSVQELCERYSVKDFTVWDWIRTGKLAAMKIGKSYRIKESDLLNFEKKSER